MTRLSLPDNVVFRQEERVLDAYKRISETTSEELALKEMSAILSGKNGGSVSYKMYVFWATQMHIAWLNQNPGVKPPEVDFASPRELFEVITADAIKSSTQK